MAIKERISPARLLSSLTMMVCLGVPAVGTATADVPEFDTEAPTDLDRYEGSEWPDEQKVTAAFERQYPAFDNCVVSEKGRTEIERLEGDAGMAVLLNPAGHQPLGVNAELPPEHERRGDLIRCLRVATAHADYPSYDGPPLVVRFEFEIDPGDTAE